jgi:small subunit ribosomal protein S1
LIPAENDDQESDYLTADQTSGTQTSATDERDELAAESAPMSDTGFPTSDPGDEAGIGSSGARALGEGSAVADRVADAVGAMTAAETDGADGSDGSTRGGGTATATAERTEEPERNVVADSTDGAEPTDGTDGAQRTDGTAGADRAESPDGMEVPAAEQAQSSALQEAPPASATDNGAAPAELGPEPTTMEELLGEQTENIKSFKHGDVVEGTVVRIDKDEILVDIGAKSEGVVSNRELYGRHAEGQPQLSIGDTVLVYVLQPESNEGHVVLSLRRAGLERKWRAMQEQLDAGTIIEAPVIDHNKGGLIVDCGIRGFVPISQIVDFPRRPQNDQPRDAAQEIAEKLQPFVGRKLRLKILEVNRKANRLILSEKVALYEERREKRDELFSSLKVGQKVTGTVRSIAPFGVFVDLGGIDGLVHKSELSWNKVNNPEAGYRIGEEVEAEVIDINHERGRISLSIRRLQPDPWHSTVADFNVGDVIDGTVTKIVNFGAFVRVREGLEGLIHISELSHQRVAHPADVVHEGQRLKLKIISLDQERHRLGLSLKQAEEPPARPAAAEQAAPRERGRRQERYDASQAVQEPEGGIDNTLAAAFAQVRQQMEETEQARDGSAQTAEATPVQEGAASSMEAADQVAPSAEQVAETLTEAGTDTDAPLPETADAPALAVGPAGPGNGGPDNAGEPGQSEEPAPSARRGRRSTKAATTGSSGEAAEASADTSETAAPDQGEAAAETTGTDDQGAGAPTTAAGEVDEVTAAPEGEGATTATGSSDTGAEGAGGFETTAESSGADSGATDEGSGSGTERASPDD